MSEREITVLSGNPFEADRNQSIFPNNMTGKANPDTRVNQPQVAFKRAMY